MESDGDKTGWMTRACAVVERIGLKAISSGNFGWFVLLVISSGIVFKLDSKDLKEVLLTVINKYGWAGFAVGVVVIYVSRRVLIWREKIHENEVNRLVEVRNSAVQASLALPLPILCEQKRSSMKTALEICLVIVLIGLPLHLLYWRLFRPVLLLRLKYRVFQSRDELRLMALRREVAQNEKAFPILEQRCNACIAMISQVDITHFFYSWRDHRATMEASKDLQTILESKPELRAIHRDIAMALFGAALANSPGALMIAAPFLGLSALAFWFNRFKDLLERFRTAVWGSLYLTPA